MKTLLTTCFLLAMAAIPTACAGYAHQMACDEVPDQNPVGPQGSLYPITNTVFTQAASACAFASGIGGDAEDSARGTCDAALDNDVCFAP